LKETDLDIKDREMSSRRRELEQWDSVLREKDRKFVIEQKHFTEREEALRSSEEKSRAKELDLDRKTTESRQKEMEHALAVEKYNILLVDLEARERTCANQTSQFLVQRREVNTKEASLQAKETYLKDLEVRFQDTAVKEEELEKRLTAFNKAEHHFYNVEVQAITSRHLKEKNHLKEIVEKQLVVSSNFQSELNKARINITQLTEENNSTKDKMNEHIREIDSLKLQILEYEEQRVVMTKELHDVQLKVSI
jgi:hypothetical protein